MHAHQSLKLSFAILMVLSIVGCTSGRSSRGNYYDDSNPGEDGTVAADDDDEHGADDDDDDGEEEVQAVTGRAVAVEFKVPLEVPLAEARVVLGVGLVGLERGGLDVDRPRVLRARLPSFLQPVLSARY